MRIRRVMSSDPTCAPNCPEWISAEGIITPGATADLARVVSSLGGRRLPVLISSRGGTVRDALEMGALIREKGLAVAVARTLIASCPERTHVCAYPLRGQAIVGGAACASACPLVLAGGVERAIGPTPLIGVHQITTVVKETEGDVRLAKTIKIYEQAWVDRTVEDYLTHMGIGEPVMTLLRKTPAASIRWLSLYEIETSGLATEALDPAQPILAEGANGLNGRQVGDAMQPDLITAKVPDKDGLGALLSLTYRRGGGALEFALTEPSATPSATDWTAAVGSAASLVLKAADSGSARALLPRDRFCAAAGDGRIIATPTSRASPAPRSVSFDLAAAADAKALWAEACP
jgi:hypothetical protein